jgi:hypothetical protein
MHDEEYCSQCWNTLQTVHVSKISNAIRYSRNIEMFNLVRKKSPEQQHDPSSSPSKRFWAEQLASSALQGQLPLDSNIENISANINRVDSERLLAVVTAAQQKLQQNFYSSDESNDESLIIDQENS